MHRQQPRKPITAQHATCCVTSRIEDILTSHDHADRHSTAQQGSAFIDDLAWYLRASEARRIGHPLFGCRIEMLFLVGIKPSPHSADRRLVVLSISAGGQSTTHRTEGSWKCNRSYQPA
jgi:hypothetical protein